jgi:hypothetical protein
MRNKETLEEAGLKYIENRYYKNTDCESFITGAKSDVARDYWYQKFQQEQNKKFYSQEDMKQSFENGVASGKYQQEYGIKGSMDFNYFIEQFKNK